MQHAIVFLDRELVDAKVRRPNFPHTYKEYQSTWSPEDIVARLKDATIAIINKVPMRADTLKQLPESQADRRRRDRHRRGRQGLLQGQRHHRRQYPQLRLQHRARARHRADLRAPPQPVRLCRGHQERRVEQVEPVLLPDASDPRHRRLHARHRRLWRARQVDRQARRGARHEGAALRHLPARRAGRFRHDPARKRHYYFACAADAGDQEHDRRRQSSRR